MGGHYIRLNRSALPCPPMVAGHSVSYNLTILTMMMTLIKVKVTMSKMTMIMKKDVDNSLVVHYHYITFSKTTKRR